MTLQDRIIELLEAHRPHMVMWWQGCTCMDGQDNPGWSPQRHSEHVAELIAQVAEEHYRPRIETVEQLDALDYGSLVRLNDGMGIARRSFGWFCANDDDDEYESDEFHHLLPGFVLWSPGAGE